MESSQETQDIVISDTCSIIMIRLIEDSEFKIFGESFGGIGTIHSNVYSLQEINNWIHDPKHKRKYKKFSKIKDQFLESLVKDLKKIEVGDFNQAPARISFYRGQLPQLNLKRGKPPGLKDLAQLYYCERESVKLITEDYQLCQLGKHILGQDRCFNIFEFLVLLEKAGILSKEKLDQIESSFNYIEDERFDFRKLQEARTRL